MPMLAVRWGAFIYFLWSVVPIPAVLTSPTGHYWSVKYYSQSVQEFNKFEEKELSIDFIFAIKTYF